VNRTGGAGQRLLKGTLLRVRSAVGGLALLPLWLVAGCADRADTDAERARAAPAAAGTTETLLSVMAGLRADMIRLHEGLWTGDFRGVAEAAESVAEHPEVSPAERLRVHTALGDGFADFVAADRRVHDLALGVRDAALREDTAAVLRAVSALQQGCVACHTGYRDRLSR
jgi:cytochrome c556